MNSRARENDMRKRRRWRGEYIVRRRRRRRRPPGGPGTRFNAMRTVHYMRDPMRSRV